MVDAQFADGSYAALYAPFTPTTETIAPLRAAGLVVSDDEAGQRASMHGFWQDMLVLSGRVIPKLKLGARRAKILAMPDTAMIAAYVAYRRQVRDALDAGRVPFLT